MPGLWSHLCLAFAVTLACVGPAATNAAEPEPVIIGIDADLSGATAEIGEAIRRGCALAVAEINANGGVLGRPLALLPRDHRGNPARGIDNLTDFAALPNLLAVVGGVHTPVALAQLDAIHQHQIIYLGPWAAGTPVVENGREPNYVFRVSVRDQFAGARLVEAMTQRNLSKPGLLLERTGWGRSNQAAITTALTNAGLEAAGVEWFGWGVTDLSEEVSRLRSAGADCMLLVANANEGAVATASVMQLDHPLPVLSHWGIAAGGLRFAERVRPLLDAGLDLTVLTTASLSEHAGPRAPAVRAAYLDTFGPDVGEAGIVGSPGVAHAYDLVHLICLAATQAGTLERSAVRDALEQLDRFDGAVRSYQPPFSRERHDALNPSDLYFGRIDTNGLLVITP